MSWIWFDCSVWQYHKPMILHQFVLTLHHNYIYIEGNIQTYVYMGLARWLALLPLAPQGSMLSLCQWQSPATD